MAWIGVSAENPVTGKTIEAVSLLSGEGLRLILTKAVTNFTSFAPVGVVLVAMLGIGIAERSGLLGTLLRRLVSAAPDSLLTFIVVVAGVLSSLAADAGYVVLIPLAGALFYAAGRPPLAGIAAAFAGVSAGFSANLLIGPIDALLSGITTEAAQLMDKEAFISPAANYYFMVASTFLIGILGTIVTNKIVMPYLEKSQSQQEVEDVEVDQAGPLDGKGLRNVGLFTLVFVGLVLLAVLPESAPLRHPETGSIVVSPFIGGIVVIISVYFALAGAIFGYTVKEFSSSKDVIEAMESTMATMAGYVVLMFFAAQFVNYFGWTNLGMITAIKGAAWLETLSISPVSILLIFIVMTASINMLIGSASAKWALLAPVFVPMLMLSGISPEMTQVAYRVGDSVTNIITPLMPYFGIVVAFAQKYDKEAGIGNIAAVMLPYSIILLIGWGCLLGLWLSMGWPLGPGA
jgi:aminobenzoyl-glutamate transport protein